MEMYDPTVAERKKGVKYPKISDSINFSKNILDTRLVMAISAPRAPLAIYQLLLYTQQNIAFLIGQ